MESIQIEDEIKNENGGVASVRTKQNNRCFGASFAIDAAS